MGTSKTRTVKAGSTWKELIAVQVEKEEVANDAVFFMDRQALEHILNDHGTLLIDKVKYVAAQAMAASELATVNNIRLGQVVSMAAKHNITVDMLREIARKEWKFEIPSNSRCSVYRTVYDTYLGPLETTNSSEAPTKAFRDTLSSMASVPIDKLYHAARLVGRKTKDGTSAITIAMALKMAASSPDRTLRELARPGVIESATTEAVGRRIQMDEGLRTVTINESSRDAVLELKTRLEALTSQEISVSKIVEFSVQQVMTLNDESLEYLWREAHGEVTAEEAANVHVLDLEVEGN